MVAILERCRHAQGLSLGLDDPFSLRGDLLGEHTACVLVLPRHDFYDRW